MELLVSSFTVEQVILESSRQCDILALLTVSDHVTDLTKTMCTQVIVNQHDSGLSWQGESCTTSDFLRLLYNEKPQIHAGSKTWEA